MSRYIDNKRVLNIASRLTGRGKGAEIRVVTEVNETVEAKLTQVGFSVQPQDGETVLPPPLGPVSRVNAQGRWVVHRDQPKELRYMRTVLWHWRTWAERDQYEEHEDGKNVCRTTGTLNHNIFVV